MIIGRIARVTALLLCLAMTAPLAARADELRDLGTTLGVLSDLIREADYARQKLDRISRQGRYDDAYRYERRWREYEYRLEEARVDRIARFADVSRMQVRDMRASGMGWPEICRYFGVSPRSIGYGYRLYDAYDREFDDDLYRGYYKSHPHGGPPGLMKKGGMPPGKARKWHD